MKAWMVHGADDDNGSFIVFAESRNEARKKAQFTDACENDRYIDINAKRLPGLDGMEDCEPKDNLWLNEEIRLILVRDYGWHCLESGIHEDCNRCNARIYCKEGEI